MHLFRLCGKSNTHVIRSFFFIRAFLARIANQKGTNIFFGGISVADLVTVKIMPMLMVHILMMV